MKGPLEWPLEITDIEFILAIRGGCSVIEIHFPAKFFSHSVEEAYPLG